MYGRTRRHLWWETRQLWISCAPWWVRHWPTKYLHFDPRGHRKQNLTGIGSIGQIPVLFWQVMAYLKINVVAVVSIDPRYHGCYHDTTERDLPILMWNMNAGHSAEHCIKACALAGYKWVVFWGYSGGKNGTEHLRPIWGSYETFKFVLNSYQQLLWN